MSMPIWILVLLSRTIVIVECAPKLGHVLFDPLSFEAEKFERVKALLDELISNKRTTRDETTVTPVTKTITTKMVITTSTTQPTSSTSAARKEINQPKKLSDLFKTLNTWEGYRRQANPVNIQQSNNTEEPGSKEPCAEYEYNGKICKIINNRLLCGYNKNKGELKNDAFIDIGNGCRMHNERIECGYESGPFKNPRRPPARDEIPNQDETLTADNENIPKLRTNDTNDSGRIITGHCNECITSASKSNENVTPKIETTSSTTEEITTTQVNTDDWLEMDETSQAIPELNSTPKSLLKLMAAAEYSPELETTNYLPEIVESTKTVTESGPELVEITKSTTESLPELVEINKTTTNSLQKFVVETVSSSELNEAAKVTTDSTSELVMTTLEPTVSDPKPVPTLSTKSSKGLVTTVSTTSESTVINNTFKKNSPLPKVLRILRSVAETTKIPATKSKPARWCVEKGDRIVCYYAKNS